VVRENFMFRPFVLAGAILALTFHAAVAQQPTQAQRDAIRASCRSDFMANCSGVTPGGKEALECLLRNQAKLSPACNSAVSAILPAKPPAPPAPAAAEAPAAPAPAASRPATKNEATKNEAAKSEPAKSEPANSEQAPPQPAAAAASEPAPKSPAAQQAQLKSVRQSCTLNDFMAHCSWIKPDNPELLLCLQANASDLSQPCRAAVQAQPQPAAQTPPAAPERKAATKSKKSTASREPAAMPAPSSAPAASAPPAAPTEAQKSAIRAACRSDFMANCSGVTPGSAEALQCLKSHAASLSAACQSAVAAIGGGAGGSAGPAASSAASAAGAPAAGVPTPAVAPLGTIPPMRPRDAIGILAMCRAEHESLCGDVPLGGGRVLTCLADHAQQLSLQCYEALSRATR
jgi:hypothetical protein